MRIQGRQVWRVGAHGLGQQGPVQVRRAVGWSVLFGSPELAEQLVDAQGPVTYVLQAHIVAISHLCLPCASLPPPQDAKRLLLALWQHGPRTAGRW